MPPLLPLATEIMFAGAIGGAEQIILHRPLPGESFRKAKRKNPFNWRVLRAVWSQEIPTRIDIGHEKLTGPSFLRALLRFQKAPRTLGSAEC